MKSKVLEHHQTVDCPGKGILGRWWTIVQLWQYKRQYKRKARLLAISLNVLFSSFRYKEELFSSNALQKKWPQFTVISPIIVLNWTSDCNTTAAWQFNHWIKLILIRHSYVVYTYPDLPNVLDITQLSCSQKQKTSLFTISCFLRYHLWLVKLCSIIFFIIAFGRFPFF